MPRLYALTAAGGCGKTETLTELTNLLPGWNSISHTINDFRPGDDVGTALYHNMLVGVITDSDTPAAKVALDELIAQGCEVIICAAHPQTGGCVNWDIIPDIANTTTYNAHQIDQCIIHATNGNITTPQQRRIVAARNRHIAKMLKSLI